MLFSKIYLGAERVTWATRVYSRGIRIYREREYFKRITPLIPWSYGLVLSSNKARVSWVNYPNEAHTRRSKQSACNGRVSKSTQETLSSELGQTVALMRSLHQCVCWLLAASRHRAHCEDSKHRFCHHNKAKYKHDTAYILSLLSAEF